MGTGDTACCTFCSLWYRKLYYCMYCVRNPLSWVLYFCDHRCCTHPDIYSDWVQSCRTEGISFQLCCHADAARVPLAGGSKVLEEDRSRGAQTGLKAVSNNWGRGAKLTVPILRWASARDRAELHALQEQHPILYCHGELQVRVWLDSFFWRGFFMWGLVVLLNIFQENTRWLKLDKTNRQFFTVSPCILSHWMLHAN